MKGYTENNEKGYVLVLSLLALLILTLLAVAGLTSSSFESTIAGNDWRAKRVLYKADGGTELGIELLEYSFACGSINIPRITAGIQVTQGKDRPYVNTDIPIAPFPSTLSRDVCWPTENTANPNLEDCNVNANAEQTNIVIFGDKETISGESLGAGYMQPNQVGVQFRHQIFSNNTMTEGSSATVLVEWIHRVGQEEHGSICR